MLPFGHSDTDSDDQADTDTAPDVETVDVEAAPVDVEADQADDQQQDAAGHPGAELDGARPFGELG